MVATDVGAISEQVVTGVTGKLIKPSDSDMLAAAALDLLRDPVRAAEMGANGRSLAERKFSLAAMHDSTEALYARLLEL